jgi:spore coat polysaccharide biosynthesis protein SpsF
VKVVAITQARMTSTRLPGKVMRTVSGKTLLAHHVERVRRAKTLDEVVVATTTKQTDDVIASWCKDTGVPVHRGSEEDVLYRYAEAATIHSADVVVRVTSDCPIIDPEVIDQTVGRFLEKSESYDYASNRIVHTFPRGQDIEVLHYRTLMFAHLFATDPADREHVTLHVWRQPQRFRLLNVPNAVDESVHRWTVDTPEDFELIRRLIDDLYPRKPDFGMQDCLAALRRHPDWTAINAHIQQKEVVASQP